jgi:ketosteroid isomerase-like protein
MTSANVVLVQRVGAAWGRGDYNSGDWADPEIEFVIADGPSPAEWRGYAGMAEGWRTFLSAWEGFRGEGPLEYRELDDERVLVLHSFAGRGKSSGLDVGQIPIRAASVFDIRAGKVVKFVIYFDRERAFADLGLTPDTGT